MKKMMILAMTAVGALGAWAATMNFINTSDGVFDILQVQMNSLSLQKTLLERRNYAGDGMGVGSFYVKEVA